MPKDSPFGTLSARVVVENECSYLYVTNSDPAANPVMRCCWIKNHAVVPEGYDALKNMKKGMQPKILSKYCKSAEDLTPLNVENLELVWGEEGQAAFLFENDNLVCVIPYWANQELPGYSVFSNNENVSGVPISLGENNAMFENSKKAKEFWAQDFSVLWKEYQESYLNELEEKYGENTNYYAIDGGNFPSKGLVIHEKDGICYAFTVGLGLLKQPKVEMYLDDPAEYAHIELGFSFSTETTFDRTNAYAQISSIAAIPWKYNTFLADRHTTEFQINETHKQGVLISSKHTPITHSDVLNAKNINLLWILPINTETFENLKNGDPHNEIEERIKNGMVFQG